MSTTSKLNIRNIGNEYLQHPTSGALLPLDTTPNITCLQHGSLMLGLNMRFCNILNNIRNIRKQRLKHPKTHLQHLATSKHLDLLFQHPHETLATFFTNI
jgi:hypothetical protein